MSMRSRLLGTSRGYSWFRRLLRAERATTIVVDDHIRPFRGARVLDLGCGNGDLSRFIEGAEYVGVDHNVRYLAKARVREGELTRFYDADLDELDDLDIGTFDIVVMLGVLHHLDTELATRTVERACVRLRPGGRLVTLDPAFHPAQRTIARVLMALDRGLYVRHPEDYERIVGRSFDRRTVRLRSDLAPFPYTHCIIEAERSASSVAAASGS